MSYLTATVEQHLEGTFADQVFPHAINRQQKTKNNNNKALSTDQGRKTTAKTMETALLIYSHQKLKKKIFNIATLEKLVKA